MTIEDFEKIPDGQVFETGVLPDSLDGINMTSSGAELRWVAKKGYGHDWAIYCHLAENSVSWIKQHGDKVQDERNIKRCIPCTDEVFKLYRQ